MTKYNITLTLVRISEIHRLMTKRILADNVLLPTFTMAKREITFPHIPNIPSTPMIMYWGRQESHFDVLISRSIGETILFSDKFVEIFATVFLAASAISGSKFTNGYLKRQILYFFSNRKHESLKPHRITYMLMYSYWRNGRNYTIISSIFKEIYTSCWKSLKEPLTGKCHLS